ncbi:DinB family protein [Paenibacillaceae bacterium WGS1546]|uniref:DinB family protein n=1 Tax=Cohnella sp. WGS1546 TaxID=3366810 RepID=UPI00372D806F
MNAKQLLQHAWDCAYSKEEWYAPLAEALRGVTLEQAVWKPQGEPVNSIWETVEHLIFYKTRLLRRLTGEESEHPPGLTNDDTFAIGDATEERWIEAQARLKNVHLALGERLAGLEEQSLDERIPDTPIGVWFLNLALHDANHVGQMIFLRKLQGSWPSRRSYE